MSTHKYLSISTQEEEWSNSIIDVPFVRVGDDIADKNNDFLAILVHLSKRNLFNIFVMIVTIMILTIK